MKTCLEYGYGYKHIHISDFSEYFLGSPRTKEKYKLHLVEIWGHFCTEKFPWCHNWVNDNPGLTMIYYMTRPFSVSYENWF